MTKKNNKTAKAVKKWTLTTLAVNVSVSERIEEYCKRCGMLKKDFVPRAIEYIENFDVDLAGATFLKGEEVRRKTSCCTADHPEETRREKLDKDAEIYRMIGALEERSSKLDKDNARMKEELDAMRQEMIEMAILLSEAKVELRRLNKVPGRPDEGVLEDLGLQK